MSQEDLDKQNDRDEVFLYACVLVAAVLSAAAVRYWGVL